MVSQILEEVHIRHCMVLSFARIVTQQLLPKEQGKKTPPCIFWDNRNVMCYVYFFLIEISEKSTLLTSTLILNLLRVSKHVQNRDNYYTNKLGNNKSSNNYKRVVVTNTISKINESCLKHRMCWGLFFIYLI